jgi:hypothetical protein
MYKVRFHLGKGEHYMHWQIVDKESDLVMYYNPEEQGLLLHNCTLKNHMGTAEKIFRGANKSVCAWVLCEDYELTHQYHSSQSAHQLYYNPRELPFWHVPKRTYHNLDNCFIKAIRTNGRTLWSV